MPRRNSRAFSSVSPGVGRVSQSAPYVPASATTARSKSQTIHFRRVIPAFLLRPLEPKHAAKPFEKGFVHIRDQIMIGIRLEAESHLAAVDFQHRDVAPSHLGA